MSKAFWEGFSSTLSLGGNDNESSIDFKLDERSDEERLAQDWQVIGDMIVRVVEKCERDGSFRK